MRMKCFVCGCNCVTQYHYGPSHGEDAPPIKAVNKICPSCGWESYPTKIPDKLAK